MNARETAFLSLQKYETSGVYSNIELSYAIERNALEGAEKALYTALFYGVIERRLTLDHVIASLSDRDPSEIDLNVRIILRLGLYQLLYMTRIPESAAVNESVKLARRFYARKNSEAFINALLREFLRRGKAILYPDAKKEPFAHLSVLHSVPEWICRLFTESYGAKTAHGILDAVHTHPTLTLSVNTLRTTRDALLLALEKEGIATEKSEISPSSIRLCSSLPLDRLAPFAGEYFVQDEASALAVLAMAPLAGEQILDACACPGGKSFGMAIAMQNKGAIRSLDLHKNKLSLIEKGASELGISILTTGVQNGAAFNPEMPVFDKILCDVPCSGLGVLAKKPDIRYKKEEDILRLPALQKEILKTNAAYLKDGGTLVYSTCTLNPAENREVVTEFLASHSDFSLCPFTAGALESNGILEIFPQQYGTDGFFIAKLKKQSEKSF